MVSAKGLACWQGSARVQVSSMCQATLQGVDERHERLQSSFRGVRDNVALTEAKCEALAEQLGKVHRNMRMQLLDG